MFIGHQCWPSVIRRPSHLGPPFAHVLLALSFCHSRPCCSVGGAVVVVVIVIVISSLSPSPIPHRSHLCPCCHALIASPWPSLSSILFIVSLSSPHHSSSSSSYSLLLLVLLFVCFWGCDMAGGAYLVRGVLCSPYVPASSSQVSR